MAKIFENKKGFKVIEATRGEMMCALSEYVCVGICDSCGESKESGYYIAVLNCWYCKECFYRWYYRAKYYPGDAEIENRNFELYRQILDV